MAQTITHTSNGHVKIHATSQTVIDPPQEYKQHIQTVTTYSPEWWNLRKTYIGASEVAALCGLDTSGRKTPEQVAQKKFYNPDSYTGTASTVNSPSWWGLEAEPLIIKAAVYEAGLSEHRHSVTRDVSFADTLTGLMASPDAYIPEIGVMFEAKEVGESNSRLWHSGPPIGFVIQAHAQMTVMGPQYTCVYLAARIKGAPVQTWKIDRNEHICSAIADIVKTFWTQFLAMTSSEWEIYVQQRLEEAGVDFNPPEKGSTSNNTVHTITSDEQRQLVNTWQQVRQAHKTAEADKKKYDGLIAELLGEADTIADIAGTPLIRRTWINRITLDTKKLVDDYPELEKEYSYPLSYARISTVRGKK